MKDKMFYFSLGCVFQVFMCILVLELFWEPIPDKGFCDKIENLKRNVETTCSDCGLKYWYFEEARYDTEEDV